MAQINPPLDLYSNTYLCGGYGKRGDTPPTPNPGQYTGPGDIEILEMPPKPEDIEAKINSLVQNNNQNKTKYSLFSSYNKPQFTDTEKRYMIEYIKVRPFSEDGVGKVVLEGRDNKEYIYEAKLDNRGCRVKTRPTRSLANAFSNQ